MFRLKQELRCVAHYYAYLGHPFWGEKAKARTRAIRTSNQTHLHLITQLSLYPEGIVGRPRPTISLRKLRAALLSPPAVAVRFIQLHKGQRLTSDPAEPSDASAPW